MGASEFPRETEAKKAWSPKAGEKPCTGQRAVGQGPGLRGGVENTGLLRATLGDTGANSQEGLAGQSPSRLPFRVTSAHLFSIHKGQRLVTGSDTGVKGNKAIQAFPTFRMVLAFTGEPREIVPVLYSS